MKTNETPWQQLRDESVLTALSAKIKRQFKPKTANQKKYLDALEQKIVTIVAGPAGTGKTYIACGFAARLLKEGRVDRVIITRPIVSCGKGYGFRPGSVEEKVLPVMRPLLDAFREFFGSAELTKLLEEKRVEILPLDDMRGCSLPKTLLICDEAQNAEPNQLHMLLTRFGEGSKVIVTGDDSRTQTDLQHHGQNPLTHIMESFEPQCHKDVALIRLERKDIVRHPLIQWIDERIVDGPPSEGWASIACPKCRASLWFETNDADLLECWKCRRKIELLNEKDEVDPIVVVTEDEGQITYQVRP